MFLSTVKNGQCNELLTNDDEGRVCVVSEFLRTMGNDLKG